MYHSAPPPYYLSSLTLIIDTPSPSPYLSELTVRDRLGQSL